MNWDAIGAVGEIVGALAVVITLLYLSAQIRHSNRATQSESIRAQSSAFNEINGWLVNDESLARIFRLGTADLAELTEDESVRFSFIMLSTFHVFETLFLQNRVETIESSVWEAEKRSLRTLLAQAGAWEWWDSNPYAFTDEFRQFVSDYIVSDTQ